MNYFACASIAIATAISLAGVAAHAQTPGAPPTATSKETRMSQHISGSFDVKMTPQTSPDKPADAIPGRMSIDKQFHGELEASSKGEMLAAMSQVKGSAGYVAIEQVTGKLQGRSGSFVLQHSGTMNRGTPQLTVSVVPDSGTGQLEGLAGSMKINIVEGKHFYEFDYTLSN